MNKPDPIFAEPRLAQIYDALDPDRSDLDAYVALVDELGARSVLDVGCGTGTFACLLAEQGMAVVGVDPAAASLEVARVKPMADPVRWLLGDATSLPPLSVDLATMTGNVAQVFVDDDDWHATLVGISEAIRPGGHLAFEVRDPDREDWRSWTRDQSHRRTLLAGVGMVESWVELVEVVGPLVTFEWTYRFEAGGDPLTSRSTLRFRSRDEIEDSLPRAGFELIDVRDAPDRPGKEFVFLARRQLIEI